jgi:hydroxymethylpyrimidine kinase/phosphomethylpyrimidine kinase
MRVVLTIAGFDPSGGAGVLADIKTFAAFGCYGVAAITALTAQNTLAVYEVYPQTAAVLRGQLEPLLADFELAAVKLGMLPTRALIETVAELLESRALPNVVLDPVLRSTSGHALLDEAALHTMIERLLPQVDLLTPNLPEAEKLSGLAIRDLAGMQAAAQHIGALCAERRRNAPLAVLLKGGHLPGAAALDLLAVGQQVEVFQAPRLATRNTHGTGCTLAAAIGAALAQGQPLVEAVARAKTYLNEAMRTAPHIGHGAGPLNHFARVD